MAMIDLRSDTVTQPTEKMRAAMAQAEVGDDVFEEDPTVRELEDTAAKMLGKEAALFTVSGTMGNLISLLAHTQPGQEVILEARSHIYGYEVGGISRIGGLIPRPLPSENGLFSAEQLSAALRPANIHFPPTSLVCLENTHNGAGGRVLPTEQVAEVAVVARQHQLKLHLDGARIFNAATFLGKPVAELAAPFDSVMFCLSKGLAAPVGSVVVGNKDFIRRARGFRKMVGGGMRQAGVLAAAGLIALTEMTGRLAEDHANARRLADGLAQLPGLSIANDVQTNMAVLDTEGSGLLADDLLQAWRERNILALAVSPTRIRLVIHYQISTEQIDEVIAQTEQIIESLGHRLAGHGRAEE